MKITRSFTEESEDKKRTSGKLYLVGTPIGNMEDITLRALRTLREVDWIAAEDTRQTRKLLTHFEISGRLVSYHEHNKLASGAKLLEKLLEGDSVALVSDAGMPAISDPGEDLVCLAAEQGIAVVPIPGASALVAALVISGLPTSSFRFVGFLPRVKKKLKLALEELAASRDTLIVYESPHRLEDTIRMMLHVWGDRRIAVIRELTKRYEEAIRGTIAEVIDYLENNPPKGEYVLVAEGCTSVEKPDDSPWWAEMTVESHVQHYENLNYSRKDARKKAAADRGVSKREIYKEQIKKIPRRDQN